jgi:hypothetical protein
VSAQHFDAGLCKIGQTVYAVCLRVVGRAMCYCLLATLQFISSCQAMTQDILLQGLTLGSCDNHVVLWLTCHAVGLLRQAGSVLWRGVNRGRAAAMSVRAAHKPAADTVVAWSKCSFSMPVIQRANVAAA